MSNYFTKAKRPRQKNYTKEKQWEEVEMLDNYFGSHKYGVKFPDGKVYPEEECVVASIDARNKKIKL